VLVSIGVVLAIVGIAVASTYDRAPWITARQLYALWALAFLLASMLVAVVPKLPWKPYLLAARRSVGVASCCFAVAHVTCYLAPVLLRNWRDWRDIFAPGRWWTVGLILGVVALSLMVPLTWSSRDVVIKAMGGARWKRLHRLVYVLLPIALLHAVLVGSDFGAHRAPDVQGEPDTGSLVVFAGLSLIWLLLIVLRRRRRTRA
jgi:MYXO-CTERM domain-containing protein